MIIPDVNLLIYAYDSSSPHHDAAGKWWKGCMTGKDRVGLATSVIFGFVRISTHPRIFRHPLTLADAAIRVQSWMMRPQVRVIEHSSRHVADVLELLEETGTAGNLTTDAQIAALARQENGVIHSHDADFIRFAGIRWHDPLTGSTNKG
jgi:hypothetical protein